MTSAPTSRARSHLYLQPRARARRRRAAPAPRIAPFGPRYPVGDLRYPSRAASHHRLRTQRTLSGWQPAQRYPTHRGWAEREGTILEAGDGPFSDGRAPRHRSTTPANCHAGEDMCLSSGGKATLVMCPISSGRSSTRSVATGNAAFSTATYGKSPFCARHARIDRVKWPGGHFRRQPLDRHG
jgi:hypothetical protein